MLLPFLVQYFLLVCDLSTVQITTVNVFACNKKYCTNKSVCFVATCQIKSDHVQLLDFELDKYEYCLDQLGMK